MSDLTFGQKAVRLTFNPSGDPLVNSLKQSYADIVDALNDLRNTTESQEIKRLASTGITQAQIACMCAVGAATWKD